MPLGAMFEGECQYGGLGEPRLCNFGYARGLCAEFPDAAPADAVRFSVSGNEGGVLTLVWILERDHAPLNHGLLKYTESTGEFAATPDGLLAEQARVFIENYLRR